MSEIITISSYCSLAVILFWLFPARYRHWVVILTTATFLSIYAPISLAILLLSSASGYWAFRILPSLNWATFLAILQIAACLFLFKLGIGQSIVSPLDRFIPLGLAYYTLRQIHYCVEMYKEQLPKHSYVDYLSYLFFLPTLLYGPIHRFPNFLRDRYRSRFDSKVISAGLERILYGASKVLIIGGLLINQYLFEFILAVKTADLLWLTTYLLCVKYTLSAYFLFAGFSDIAIGLSLLFGHRIMENFNYPFLAGNLNEFWKRWHISLSSWLKEYIFFPVSSLSRSAILGVLATMVLIGLWHEISLHYLIWGLFHGLGIGVWYIYKNSSIAKRLAGNKWYEASAVVLTFHFVVLSFIFIREPNWEAVGQTFSILFGIN